MARYLTLLRYFGMSQGWSHRLARRRRRSGAALLALSFFLLVPMFLFVARETTRKEVADSSAKGPDRFAQPALTGTAPAHVSYARAKPS